MMGILGRLRLELELIELISKSWGCGKAISAALGPMK